MKRPFSPSLDTIHGSIICTGVVYSLKNLRMEEAVLSFVNLTLNMAEGPDTTQQDEESTTSQD